MVTFGGLYIFCKKNVQAPKSKSKQDVPEKCYINLFMYYITLHTL